MGVSRSKSDRGPFALSGTVARETDRGPVILLGIVPELPVINAEPPERADAARNRRRVLDGRGAAVRARRPGVRDDGGRRRRGRRRQGHGLPPLRRPRRASRARSSPSTRSSCRSGMIRGAPPLGPGRAGARAPDRVRRARTWQFLDRHVDLLLAAEGATGPGWRASVYALYRTHVALLLREAGCGEQRRYLADVLMAPLAAPAFIYHRQVRRPVARGARRRVRGPRRAAPRLIAMTRLPAPSTRSPAACRPPATCRASPPRWSSYLAARLGKPVLVEGPAGVGKTELAKKLAAVPGPRPRAPAVLRGPRRGQGAVRVELPQAAAADPGRGRGHRLAGRAGRHLRRGVPALAAAAAGDRVRGARSCC